MSENSFIYSKVDHSFYYEKYVYKPYTKSVNILKLKNKFGNKIG